MDHPIPGCGAVGEWIARDAIPFSHVDPRSLNAAVDALAASLGGAVEMLGLGEPLHGGEDFLLLRNRVFERLAEAHGYRSIAVESCFFRGRLVDEYVAGGGAASYDAVRDEGFSHGFGRYDANRELVEWMRGWNADPARGEKVRFYGFDGPMEMTGAEGPRRMLRFVIDYLLSAGDAGAAERWGRIDPLIGNDADWENPAAMMDPSKSIGLSPAATALRIEAEGLVTELEMRRPGLSALTGRDRHAEALHCASMARRLLAYHAEFARESDDRIARGLGIRDLMMADTLAYIASRERGRGKTLVFAHNSHLRRGEARWRLGPHALAWWPAGSHAGAILGPRYAVIGSGLGVSADNGVGAPEAGTLEALLTAAGTGALFIPTHGGKALPAAAAEALPVRSGSARNPGYFPLTPQCLADFDWLAILPSTGYARGAPPLP